MFKKSELRNSHSPLLRRIQRQVEVAKAKQVEEPIVLKGGMLRSFNASFSVPEEKLILKDTRLKLYKKRGGR